MVFVLLLSSTKYYEVVALICYKTLLRHRARGNMRKNCSSKPDISLSFLFDIISINDICIYGCIAFTVVFIFKSTLSIRKLNCRVLAMSSYLFKKSAQISCFFLDP
ncbi:BAK_1a_G0025270.mRNA.1.CDS.1 [Saccharomyces cerevisiae]|nr:BAK_1a_G0025270.mRNA.1.CDS.1 [Saccharomyces cerevisiae]CAI7162043.1 BAK_1a_G0025270.mRNA.1.CDS.1 [Saccharomyces cerevisiae]